MSSWPWTTIRSVRGATSEPRAIPAGSRVVINGAFDNSEYNLGNPDPSERITWGSQSWDEMFIGYFAYHNAAKINGGDDKDKKK